MATNLFGEEQPYPEEEQCKHLSEDGTCGTEVGFCCEWTDEGYGDGYGFCRDYKNKKLWGAM